MTMFKAAAVTVCLNLLAIYFAGLAKLANPEIDHLWWAFGSSIIGASMMVWAEIPSTVRMFALGRLLGSAGFAVAATLSAWAAYGATERTVLIAGLTFSALNVGFLLFQSPSVMSLLAMLRDKSQR